MNCIVAQSGGPTAAINSSLAGVIKGAIDSGKFTKIYGAVHGIQGLFNNDLLDLTDKDDEFIEKLIDTPAMYLGSCRFKLPTVEEDIATYLKAFARMEELDIGVFIYIGGNDSMDTVDKLSAYADSIGSKIKIVGVPKTIDNDLVETDHTPGFGSAAKYIASTMREIAYDISIYDLKSVTIVEIMGRDAGWLTAASVLARNEFIKAPHLVYLPETDFDKDRFIEDVRVMVEKYKNVVVAVSEGIRDKDGVYISATDAAADKFGHAQLSGAGKSLEYLVKEKLGVKVRSIEINILQRCAGHLTSETDLEEGFLLGKKAVELALTGESSVMVSVERISNSPYEVRYTSSPVSKIANKAKGVPQEWINDDKNDLKTEMIEYLKPLVFGEKYPNYNDGIVDYLEISHLT